jgi:polysaccharide pyruvyl transferase WcaK-like protein
MDMVVTMRLHGMVLALKNGIPAVAIDPQSGGAKIVRQAKEIGWLNAFSVDSATDEALARASALKQ